MREKRKNTALITAFVAGILAVVLFIAGTVLRMNTQQVGFMEAFRSFTADIFQAWKP